jgi:hypothetical protein
MTDWTFVTPTVLEGPIGGNARLWEFYRQDRGITIVLQTSGTYRQIRYPTDDTLDTYPQVYRGGYNYTVDDTTKAALIAGGVGVTESNFTAQ